MKTEMEFPNPIGAPLRKYYQQNKRNYKNLKKTTPNRLL
jgi:hypothetical protein